MSLISLPTELLLQIALLLSTPHLNTLIQTNTRFALLLTPHLYTSQITLQSTENPLAILNWGAKRIKPRCLSYMSLWSSKTILNYIRTLPKSTSELADSNGRTLVHHALKQHNAAVIDILFEKGVDVNREDNLKQSYLCYAIQTLNITAAQKLIDAGADIETSTYKGLPLLCLAVSYGSLPLAECIITGIQKRGGTLFRPDSNPNHNILHHAIYPSNDPTIKLLLSLGAPPSSVDPATGTTPLMLAISSGSDSITNLLLDSLSVTAALPPNLLATNKHGESALTFISRRRRPTISTATLERLVSLTLAAGGDISRPLPSSKATPLHLSAAAGHADGVRVLLSHGANTHAVDIAGLTPLMSALSAHTGAEFGAKVPDRQVTIQLLIDAMAGRGDDFSPRGDSLDLHLCQGTALHFAARFADVRTSIVQLLLKSAPGACVLARDAAGRTPLECALPLDNSRRPLKTRDMRVQRTLEAYEEVCLVLAKAMRDMGYDFSTALPGIMGYKASAGTWVELAAVAGMDGLGGFVRGCMSRREREKEKVR